MLIAKASGSSNIQSSDPVQCLPSTVRDNAAKHVGKRGASASTVSTASSRMPCRFCLTATLLTLELRNDQCLPKLNLECTVNQHAPKHSLPVVTEHTLHLFAIARCQRNGQGPRPHRLVAMAQGVRATSSQHSCFVVMQRKRRRYLHMQR